MLLLCKEAIAECLHTSYINFMTVCTFDYVKQNGLK